FGTQVSRNPVLNGLPKGVEFTKVLSRISIQSQLSTRGIDASIQSDVSSPEPPRIRTRGTAVPASGRKVADTAVRPGAGIRGSVSDLPYSSTTSRSSSRLEPGALHSRTSRGRQAAFLLSPWLEE